MFQFRQVLFIVVDSENVNIEYDVSIPLGSIYRLQAINLVNKRIAVSIPLGSIYRNTGKPGSAGGTMFQFRQVLFIAVTKIAIINENTRLFTILTWHFFIYKVVDPQLYKNNRESTTYIIDLIFNMSKNVLKHREVLYTHFLLIKTDIDNFHKN